jgi:hypothetical protein
MAVSMICSIVSTIGSEKGARIGALLSRLPISFFDPARKDFGRDEPYCEQRVAGPIAGSGPDADAPQHRLHRLLVGRAGGRFYHPPQQPRQPPQPGPPQPPPPPTPTGAAPTALRRRWQAKSWLS